MILILFAFCQNIYSWPKKSVIFFLKEQTVIELHHTVTAETNCICMNTFVVDKTALTIIKTVKISAVKQACYIKSDYFWTYLLILLLLLLI